MKSAPIPLPTTDEQILIVQVIEEALSHSAHAIRDLEDSRRSATALRQSVLQAAFSGKLVSQDPVDEPASVLLERIREERVATQQAAGRRRGGGGRRPLKKGETAMGKTRRDIKPTHLQDIIRARNARMAAEALWKASELDIDDFYKQLRDEVAAGHLREERDGDTSRIVCR